MSFCGGFYPQILDGIVAESDYETRLSLRGVSRYLWKEVDGVLATRLVWRDWVMWTKDETGHEGLHPLSVLNADLGKGYGRIRCQAWDAYRRSS